MGAQLPFSVGSVDQPVFRQLCRDQSADGLIGCRQGSRTFSDLVDSCKIHLISGIILQSRNLTVSATDAFDLLPGRRTVFSVVKGIAVRILHLLPAHIQAPITSGHLYAVRSIRPAVGLWNRLGRGTEAALPFSVQRLHTDFIDHTVGQLISQELLNVEFRGRRPAIVRPSLTDNTHFIGGYIVLSVPAHGERPAAGPDSHIFRDVHLRLRNPALHIVDKLHAGDLSQISGICRLRNFKCYTLHCNLAAKTDPDGAVPFRRDGKALLRRHKGHGCALRHRSHHRAAVRLLNDHDPLRDRPLFILRSTDEDLFHHRRFPVSAEIKIQLHAAAGIRQRKAAFFAGKLIHTAFMDTTHSHRNFSRIQRDEPFQRRLSALSHDPGQIVQIQKVHPAVSVQIIFRPVFSRINGIYQKIRIPAVQLSVAVQITLRQKPRMRAAGSLHTCISGIELHPVFQAVHLDLLGIGDIPASGYPHLIAARRKSRKPH